MEQQLGLADENVVTTWQNNRVARGHDGLRKFLDEIDGGAGKVFQGYTVPPEADELHDPVRRGRGRRLRQVGARNYKYLGMEFDLENRWTATVVKTDGRWKIASYHVSANILDNPVLTAAKKSTYWAAGAALLVGLLIGGFRRPPAEQETQIGRLIRNAAEADSSTKLAGVVRVAIVDRRHPNDSPLSAAPDARRPAGEELSPRSRVSSTDDRSAPEVHRRSSAPKSRRDRVPADATARSRPGASDRRTARPLRVRRCG